MAEFLLLVRDTSHLNPLDKVGDVVAVNADGFKWGKRECLGDFMVVRISNLPLEEARRLAIPYIDDTFTVACSHRYYVNVALIPKEEIDKMNSTDWYVPSISIDLINDKDKRNSIPR